MAADSDGSLTAVVICEGDLHDPEFKNKFRSFLGKLKSLIEQPKTKKLKVNKVEPWNSVRVTLSIPKDAAMKLRQLAAEGNTALRALGILSVQLEGDTVISLRLAGQEIVLRTSDNTSTNSQDSTGLGELTRILTQPQSIQSTSEPIAGPSNGQIITNGPIDTNKPPIFKSPNTVCPMDGKLPVHVPNVVESCEYPFGSMTQARVIQRRENTMGMSPTVGQFVTPTQPPPPPPPYPLNKTPINLQAVSSASSSSVGGVSSGNIAISSPLLVNLLQNEQANNSSAVPQQQQIIATSSGTTTTTIKNRTVLKGNEELVLVSGGCSSSSNSVVGQTPSSLVLVENEQVNNNKCIVNKQTIQVHHQQTFVGQLPTTTTNSSSSPSSHVVLTTNRTNHSQIVVNNINISTQQQQQQTPLTLPVPSNVNIKMQTRFIGKPQQIRTITPQQQQQIPTSRFPIHQTMFRHPTGAIIQQQQQFNQNSSAIQQQLQQQSFTPRWTLKPMDSATKTSFQEFTRYQMQYNLSQEQQQQQTNQQTVSDNFSTAVRNNDPLGTLVADLAELSKNDLDSLIPSLMPSELDSALGLDGKNLPLDALLDSKDLVDLDLIDQHPPSLPQPQPPPPPPTAVPQQIIQSQKIPTGKQQRQYLINPLTGELEPMPSEESSSETELEDTTIFTEFNSEISNSLFSDDDNSGSTGFSKMSDQSDTERSNASDVSMKGLLGKTKVKTKEKKESIKSSKKDKTGGGSTGGSSSTKSTSLFKDKIQQNLKEKLSGKTKTISGVTTKEKTKKLNPMLTATTTTAGVVGDNEKIKLRLKLEKSEPVSPAYKVDYVSYLNTQSPKRALSIGSGFSSPTTTTTNLMTTIQQQQSSSPKISSPSSSSSSPLMNLNLQQQSPQQSPAGEELRVPPLHISLRGRNSVVIKNSKKDRKKSQSGGEDGEDLIKKISSTKRNSLSIDGVVLNRKNNLHDLDEIHGYQRLRDIDEVMKNKLHDLTTINNHTSTKIIRTQFQQQQKSFDDSSESIKRTSSDLIHSPNGLNCPEKKRRLSGSQLLETNEQIDKNLEIRDHYALLKNTIGSTNVGTLPQHSSLCSTKNQQKISNNNHAVYSASSKLNNKILTKTVKPIKLKEKVNYLQQQLKKDPGKITTLTTPTTIDDVKFKQIHPPSIPIISSSSTTVASTSITTTTITTIEQPSRLLIVENDVSTKSDHMKKEPIEPHKNSHLNNHTNRPPDSTDIQILTVGTTTTTTTAQPTVRGSPTGSQAQGEDSGIESMDALSEKSPNQASQSPKTTDLIKQQRSDDSPKTINKLNKKTNNNSSIDDYANDIEAALAKMEGYNDSTSTTTTTNTCDTQKSINGDHSLIKSQKLDLLNDLTTTSITTTTTTTTTNPSTTNEQIILCATTIEHKNLDKLLIDDLLTIDKDKDMNENKEIQKTKLGKQILDECCNKDKKLNLINFDTTTTKIENLKIEQKDIKLEPTDDHSSQSQFFNQQSSQIVVVKTENDEKNKLTQLSIEIPTHESDNLPRVRTRASSKLESPLDPSKQSPLDSPATCLKTNLKLSATTVDRLSPKIATKAVKRKRQESESSTQSCVSDDTPGRSKKLKKPSTSTETTTTTPPICPKKKSENGKKSTNCNSINKKLEESSDSDEPLIEVAGKCRNSKLVNKTETEKVLRNHKTTTLTNPTTSTINCHLKRSSPSPCNSSSSSTSGIRPVTVKIQSCDEKISTRRSVRMTTSTYAKGNKLATAAAAGSVSGGSAGITAGGVLTTVVLNSAGGNSSITGGGSNISAGCIDGKTTGQTPGSKSSSTTPELTSEARRKTRSGGLEPTETRRRRSSRDGK